MNSKTEHFKEIVEKLLPVKNILIRNEDNAFEVLLECDFQVIGRILIAPFSHEYFELFRQFYDDCDPKWDLSTESRTLSNQHGTDVNTLREVENRVVSHQDARFLILTQEHVIGYLDIEEIDRIRAGQKNSFGENRYAMLDISISDRFHGTGLASLAITFLKFVAAIVQVNLYLVTSKNNERAIRFYIKHGFQKACPATDELKEELCFILEKNEFENPR